MKWTIQYTPKAKKMQERWNEIIDALLLQRNINTKEDKKEFLHPKDPLDISLEEAGIDKKNVLTAIKKIKQSIKGKQPILIFGDYDADGITATAILWETLHSLGANAIPFIPHREKHGYGLSIKGLKEALKGIKEKEEGKKPLVITVDNGIVAHEAADHLSREGVDLIITDHHQPGKTLPTALAVVHSDLISGSAVAWFLSKELQKEAAVKTLDLVTIGTVADLMPLLKVNRSIVKHGLIALKETKRPGLKALYVQAGLDANTEFSTYHIGFVIAPRLNAMGRLDDAMDSLRLLCTTSKKRSDQLAATLDMTNKNRQDLTQNFVFKAQNLVGEGEDHVLVVDSEEFHEGIIGLVAGKLTEKFSRPSIVISRGEEISKASARSVSSVNIIELIREFEKDLVNAGGHPMAAGFTIETKNIQTFKTSLVDHANKVIKKEQLQKELKIDAKIQLSDISQKFYQKLEQLKPFGMGNPRPVFAIKKARITSVQTVGKANAHLKLKLQDELGQSIEAIGFYLGSHFESLKNTSHADIAFNITENTWNGRTTLQLQIKDINLQ